MKARAAARLVVLLALAQGGAGANIPSPSSVATDLIDYCVSSRWGFSCVNPAAKTPLATLVCKLPAVCNAGLFAALYRLRASSAAHAASRFFCHAQATMGKYGARGVLLVAAVTLAHEMARDVINLPKNARTRCRERPHKTC